MIISVDGRKHQESQFEAARGVINLNTDSETQSLRHLLNYATPFMRFSARGIITITKSLKLKLRKYCLYPSVSGNFFGGGSWCIMKGNKKRSESFTFANALINISLRWMAGIKSNFRLVLQCHFLK